jgi:hypothetical protein
LAGKTVAFKPSGVMLLPHHEKPQTLGLQQQRRSMGGCSGEAKLHFSVGVGPSAHVLPQRPAGF